MKNKKIFISSIGILLVVITIFVYVKTDFLKTNEQLFWKYIWIEKDNIIEILSNNKINNYNEILEKSSYIKKGTISFTSKYNIIKPFNINILEKGNNLDENINTEIEVIYNKKNITNVSIIKDNNFYLLKNRLTDEKYIGFENDNLKQIAKKLGLANVDFIPNKIKKIDYYELFSITKQEKNHIIIKYLPILKKHIKNKNYTKENNLEIDSIEGITRYTLNVSEKELYELVIDVLRNINNDETTLEFIRNKVEVIDESNKYCEIDTIKSQIHEWINILEKKEMKNDKFLSIMLYKKERDIIKLELVFENNRTICLLLDEEDNSIILQQYNVKNNEIDLNSVSGIIHTILNNISEVIYIRNIEDEKSNVECNVICSIGMEKFELKYKFSEEINNDIGNIINKNDVEFIDINGILEDTYYTMLKNMLQVNDLK